MEKMTSQDWKDFGLLNLRGCLIVALIVLGIFVIPTIPILLSEAQHRKTYPDAATFNEKAAPEYAKTIGDALNKYYATHGEYPWQIYGGASDMWPTKGPKCVDPLQYENIIGNYPRVFIPNGVFQGQMHSVNLVSAPRDGLLQNISAETKYDETGLNEADKAPMRELRARRKKFRETVSVIMAAGGVKPSPAQIAENEGNPGPVVSILLPSIEKDMRELFGIQDSTSGVALAGNFGYVRGERMGGDKRTAFLWIYGRPDSSATDTLTGLDVLNAETGELKPDGIPDGVVLKLELRGGQVVNITKADSM
jgi:hypothetical protein